MESFDVITRYANSVPYLQEIVISLEYPDWCEFESTPLCRELMEYFSPAEIQRRERSRRETER